MIKDLFYSIRAMIHPITHGKATSILIIITLMLGIGINVAIFSVVNGIWLSPLPFSDSDRLTVLWITAPHLKVDENKFPSPGADYHDWRRQNRSFWEMAAFESYSYDMTGIGEPVRLDAVRVSSTFFRMLGVEPIIGRTFDNDEDQPGKDSVAVISQNLWERQFGSDYGVLGKKITLDAERFTIIGVLPKRFDFPEGPAMPASLQFHPKPDIWTPLAFDQNRATDRSTFNLSVLAKLKPEVSIEQAQSDMNVITKQINKTYRRGLNLGIKVIPLKEQIAGKLRKTLWVLQGAVIFVLLIACSNVVSLQLSKFSQRRKDFAVRNALGANRWRIIRQVISESIIYTFVGGGLGLALAYLGIRLLTNINPGSLPRISEVKIDTTVLLFTLIISLLASLISGIVYATYVLKIDLCTLLKEENRGATKGNQSVFIRNLLVVSQIGMALVLLIGAGLLIKSFMLLQRVEIGFNPDHVLSLRIDPPDSKYHSDQAKIDFFRQILQQVESIPGVQNAGLVTNLPLSGAAMSVTFEKEEAPVDVPEKRPRADYSIISNNYFESLGIPILRGRVFTDGDNENSRGVVVINQSMADLYWPGDQPIGKSLVLTFEGRRIDREIIGIVGNTRRESISITPAPEMYVSFKQGPQAFTFLTVRTTADPLNMASAVTNRIHQVDPEQPVSEVRSMNQVITQSQSERSFNLTLLSIFAGLGLIMSIIGVYGVIAHSVGQRTHEIGIRVALGAQKRDIIRMILSHGTILIIVGVILGLIGAIAITRILTGLLYQISVKDPFIFIISALILIVVALVATILPVYRALNIDPVKTLREV